MVGHTFRIIIFLFFFFFFFPSFVPFYPPIYKWYLYQCKIFFFIDSTKSKAFNWIHKSDFSIEERMKWILGLTVIEFKVVGKERNVWEGTSIKFGRGKNNGMGYWRLFRWRTIRIAQKWDIREKKRGNESDSEKWGEDLKHVDERRREIVVCGRKGRETERISAW